MNRYSSKMSLQKQNQFKNIERTSPNVDIKPNLIMLMACVRTAIMLKAEQRKLTYVLIKKEHYMLKEYAKTVT